MLYSHFKFYLLSVTFPASLKNFNDYCHFIIKECHNLCNYFPIMGHLQLVFIFPCYFCIISSWIWDYVFRIDSQKWNNRNKSFQTLKAMPGCVPKWFNNVHLNSTSTWRDFVSPGECFYTIYVYLLKQEILFNKSDIYLTQSVEKIL